uniref:Uncharacterized protein n=1 Tax=Amphimedon queenslandica TaxID=400682 RepID=A0A1X7U3F7_AMPQE
MSVVARTIIVVITRSLYCICIDDYLCIYSYFYDINSIYIII